MASESNIEKIILPNENFESSKIENIPSPETRIEAAPFKNDKKEVQEKIPTNLKISATNLKVSNQDWRLKRAAEIDEILAAGLNDIFLKMSAKEQANFKKTGEETVTKINILLSETKIKVNKIIDLIKKWLKLIPGVNKFFLEQEAKIKADKIINIKNKF